MNTTESHPATATVPVEPRPAVVMLPGSWFVTACAAVAGLILLSSRVAPTPLWLLATEVLATILGLFASGRSSTKSTRMR